MLTGHLDLTVQFVSTTTGRVVVDTKITQQKVEDTCGLGAPGHLVLPSVGREFEGGKK